MKRDVQIDAVRCVAVFLVVLLHAWGAAFQYVDRSTLEFFGGTFLATRVTDCAMPTLFLITGYLLFTGFEFSAWPRKMLCRFRRLVVPYVCWNVVFVLFYLGVCHFFPRVEARVEAFGLMTVAGCVTKIFHPFVHPIDGPLWYMRAVVVFASCSPILWVFLKGRYGRWIGLAMTIGYFLSCEVLHMPLDDAEYPSYALMVFYIGGVLAVSRRTIGGFFRSVWWFVPGAVGLAVSAFEHLGWCDSFGSVGCGLLVMPAFVCLVSRFSRFVPLPSSSYLFFVYCGHFLFCSVWVHVFGPRMNASFPGALTLLMGIFLVPGLALLTATWFLLRRHFPLLLRFFDGEL